MGIAGESAIDLMTPGAICWKTLHMIPPTSQCCAHPRAIPPCLQMTALVTALVRV